MSDEAMKDDFVLPIGKAKVERRGEHVTITAHSMAVKIALEAAAELEKSGVSCEVKDDDVTTLLSSFML